LKVKELHLFVRLIRGDELKRIKIIPDSQDITEMKTQLAKTIKPLTRKIKYYYVVVVVRKPDGSNGYRTVIPKQLVNV
jgi:hypothetical protein